MTENRLIMLEGLPGTGKSTNSFNIYVQLTLAGKKVRWIHEISQPHPTVFFTEACLTGDEYRSFCGRYPSAAGVLDSIAEFRETTVGIDFVEVSRRIPGWEKEAWYSELMEYDVMKFSLERYEPAALEKWTYFVNSALKEDDTVFILDSSFFQYQIFTYLLKAAEYRRLSSFVSRVTDIIRPLCPKLIYLFRKDTDDAIRYLEEQRGRDALESIRQRDKDQPYYRNRKDDVTAYYEFLRDYAQSAMRLFDEADFDRIKIDISGQEWGRYEKEMLDFLGTGQRKIPVYKAPEGRFADPEHGYEMSISGDTVTDPEGFAVRLIPGSATAFFMECLPMVLDFTGEDSFRISGQQIIPLWSETGTEYVRVCP